MTSNVNMNSQGISTIQFQKDLELYHATMENLEATYFSGQQNDPLSYWPTNNLFDTNIDFNPQKDSCGEKFMKFIGGLCALPFDVSSAVLKAVAELVDAPFELVGNIVKGIGNLVNKIGDAGKQVFEKIGKALKEIPLVGSILNGICKAAGWVTSLPFKIVGGVVKFAGKIVKGVGDILKSPFKAVGNGLKKVGKGIKKFIKKL